MGGSRRPAFVQEGPKMFYPVNLLLATCFVCTPFSASTMHPHPHGEHGPGPVDRIDPVTIIVEPDVEVETVPDDTASVASASAGFQLQNSASLSGSASLGSLPGIPLLGGLVAPFHGLGTKLFAPIQALGVAKKLGIKAIKAKAKAKLAALKIGLLGKMALPALIKKKILAKKAIKKAKIVGHKLNKLGGDKLLMMKMLEVISQLVQAQGLGDPLGELTSLLGPVDEVEDEPVIVPVDVDDVEDKDDPVLVPVDIDGETVFLSMDHSASASQSGGLKFEAAAPRIGQNRIVLVPLDLGDGQTVFVAVDQTEVNIDSNVDISAGDHVDVSTVLNTQVKNSREPQVANF